MTTPRALAMQRLREKEELARQAAILGANKRKGIMSSLPTNLGSIGQFISDDNNHAAESFELNAADYLLRPVLHSRFIESIKTNITILIIIN